MKEKLIQYLREQIDYHKNTLASEGGEFSLGDNDIIEGANRDIAELKKYIRFLRSINQRTPKEEQIDARIDMIKNWIAIQEERLEKAADDKDYQKAAQIEYFMEGMMQSLALLETK